MAVELRGVIPKKLRVVGVVMVTIRPLEVYSMRLEL